MVPVLIQEHFRFGERNRILDLVRGLLAGKWMGDDLPKPLQDREIGILYPLIPRQDQHEFNLLLKGLRDLATVKHLVEHDGVDGRRMVNEPGIKVQTIHSARGLEYRAVIIMWANLLPRDYFDDYDEAEDRRLMYVALTRAQDFLAITCSRPSTFIEEIRRSGCVIVR